MGDKLTQQEKTSPAVELLRMFLPHHMKTMCNGGVLKEMERFTFLFCKQPAGCKQHKFDTDVHQKYQASSQKP